MFHLFKKKEKIETTLKRRGFLCGYKPLLPARVSRRCFHFIQAIAFDSRQPSKGFIFYLFFLLAFSCLYACCSASENGFAYSFTLILSIAISCISCSRIYFLQLSHHSILLYLHNILHSKNVCFQTYISDFHVCQTSSILTFLSDIP